jgi:hypothetical protein
MESFLVPDHMVEVEILWESTRDGMGNCSIFSAKKGIRTDLEQTQLWHKVKGAVPNQFGTGYLYT